MATDISDGGAAFPTMDFIQGCGLVLRDHGMSLRDYFAAKVVAALISAPEMVATFTGEALKRGLTPERFVSQLAYEQADAMVAERAKARPA